MAKSLLPLILLIFTISLARSMETEGRYGDGLIGYGITMYKPNCAVSCRAVISSSALNCSTQSMEGMDGMSMAEMSGMTISTSATCYATDDIFLRTLAYCMSTHCSGTEKVPAWELEQWWLLNIADRIQNPPIPKWTYQQALDKVTTTPNVTLVSGDPLNQTSLVAETDYTSNFNAQGMFEEMEITHERYGIVLVLSGVVIPIGFSFLRFIPFPAVLVTKFSSLVITPPLWGNQHSQVSLYGLVKVPTRGQALFIAYLVTINIILSAVGFRSSQPLNAWYPNSKGQEISTYVSDRLGVLSFANLPLIILYAGRNNFLLWLTNWSHSTFILLHRWVAYLSTLQACLHSAIYLQKDLASKTYATESILPYWYWGIVATVCMAVALPTAALPIRNRFYEVFLAWHVTLAALVLLGSYLHIFYRFQLQWGYQHWILVACAVWGFEHVMRILRIARNGLRTAEMTDVGGDYMRVDIKGVAGGMGHAYLYFPTLSWRVWENHPFSVVSSIIPATRTAPVLQSEESDLESSGIRMEAFKTKTASSSLETKECRGAECGLSQPGSLGLTFFIRKQAGLTAQLQRHVSMPVLVESMYGKHEDLSAFPSLIIIAGGVGITAVMPYLQNHLGQKKLYWGVRNDSLVQALGEHLRGIEKEVFVGHRMELRNVLDDALGKSSDEGTAIVVSGPPGMADEVRLLVCKIGARTGRRSIKLVEESFSW